MQRVAELPTTSAYQDRTAMEVRARLQQFYAWLDAAGALLLETMTPWEVARYRCIAREGDEKPTTHVIYRNKAGAVTFGGASAFHWNLFRSGEKLPEQPAEITVPKKQKSWTQRTREKLIERDGTDCYYCGLTMIGHDHTGRPTPDGKDDITIEHLLSRHNTDKHATEGIDVEHIDYLSLAHAKCNRDIGHQPMHEKMIYRDIMTDGRHSSVEHWD